MKLAQKQAEERTLLAKIKENLPSLEKLLDECDCEDEVYRFYHQSFKVYGIQAYTEDIAEKLLSLAPHLPMNTWFLEILKAGTGRSAHAEWLGGGALLVQPSLINDTVRLCQQRISGDRVSCEIEAPSKSVRRRGESRPRWGLRRRRGRGVPRAAPLGSRITP